MEYHLPVMLEESVEGLAIAPGGIYIDVTFGGGGHSRAIVEKLESGHLYGFDQDADAQANAEGLPEERFTLVAGNFRHLKKFLRMYRVDKVDGILADLGISSHQIDTPERGFSTRYQGPLDMRMNQGEELTAETLVNEYAEEELHKVLGLYGEVKNAKTLARALVAARINQRIESTDALNHILRPLAPRGRENKYFAQVYQALRIAVNDEMGALEELLEQSTELLKPGGRLVVMSYHSLEDRLVKNYMAKGKFSGEPEKDFYGNLIRPLEPLTRKPVEAAPEEIARNSRARSAKLRIAKRLEAQ